MSPRRGTHVSPSGLQTDHDDCFVATYPAQLRRINVARNVRAAFRITPENLQPATVIRRVDLLLPQRL